MQQRPKPKFRSKAEQPTNAVKVHSLLSDVVTKLLPLLSALAAGAWTLWLYFSFSETQERYKTDQLLLSNEQLRMANAQAEAVSSLEVRARELAVEQQTLALSQMQLLAASERERSRITLEQQRLALQQSTASASLEIKKQELTVRLAELEDRLKTSDVRLKEQGRVAGDASLKLECDSIQDQYLGTFQVEIKNTSTVDVEIAAVVNQKFIGTVGFATSTAGLKDEERPIFELVTVNSPPVL